MGLVDTASTRTGPDMSSSVQHFHALRRHRIASLLQNYIRFPRFDDNSRCHGVQVSKKISHWDMFSSLPLPSLFALEPQERRVGQSQYMEQIPVSGFLM